MNDSGGMRFFGTIAITFIFVGLIAIGLIDWLLGVIVSNWGSIVAFLALLMLLGLVAFKVGSMKATDNPKTRNQQYWAWRNRRQ